MEEGFKEYNARYNCHLSHFYDWGSMLYDRFYIDHPPDDPFAQAVAHRMRRRVETVSGLDVQFALVVQEYDEAADRPVMLRQDLERSVQCRSKVERARERVADLEERGQPPRLPGLNSGWILSRSGFSHSERQWRC